MIFTFVSRHIKAAIKIEILQWKKLWNKEAIRKVNKVKVGNRNDSESKSNTASMQLNTYIYFQSTYNFGLCVVEISTDGMQ